MLTTQENINLKLQNTFGIDVNARFYAIANNTDELIQLFSQPHSSTFILGGGSNILFTQDYPGLIIKNNLRGIDIIKEDQEHVWIKVAAGENWHQFVLYCVEHGYAGIENLSLIPGTVGAAPIQNIGAYGVELNDCFVELDALNIQNQTIKTFSNSECQFGYRDSVFKTTLKNQFVILSITLKLNKNPVFYVTYGDIKNTLAEMQINELSIKVISDAVIHIRRSKLPDPNEIGNAGSFFKNPIISYDEFIQLQKQYPNIPHYATDDPTLIKIAAGWLIEQAGWKGKRIGDIGVHAKQALVLVNYGDGKGHEILELAQAIQSSVKEKFGVTLIPEVNII